MWVLCRAVRELKCSRLAWGGWERDSGGNSFMLSFGDGWREAEWVIIWGIQSLGFGF